VGGARNRLTRLRKKKGFSREEAKERTKPQDFNGGDPTLGKKENFKEKRGENVTTEEKDLQKLKNIRQDSSLFRGEQRGSDGGGEILRVTKNS